MKNETLASGFQDFSRPAVQRAWAQEGYDSHKIWADYMREAGEEKVLADHKPVGGMHTIEQHENWCAFYSRILARFDIKELGFQAVVVNDKSSRHGPEVIKFQGRYFDNEETTHALMGLLAKEKNKSEALQAKLAKAEARVEELEKIRAWYADMNNWEQRPEKYGGIMSKTDVDLGQRARKERTDAE